MTTLTLIALAIAWPAMAGVTGRLILRFMGWPIYHDYMENVEPQWRMSYYICKNSTEEEKQLAGWVRVSSSYSCEGCKQRKWFHAASWLWPITLSGLIIYVITTRPAIATWKAGLWLYRQAGPPALNSGDTP